MVAARASRLARLALLQDLLRPLAGMISTRSDAFDIALIPSADPRLVIHDLGFIEISAEGSAYLLHQASRHGRIRVAESEDAQAMAEAIETFVEERLPVREKVLATSAKRSDRGAGIEGAVVSEGSAWPRSPGPERRLDAGASRRFGRFSRAATIAFAFLIDLLGAVTLFIMLGAIGWYAWTRLHLPPS